jgi:hypothetical protein
MPVIIIITITVVLVTAHPDADVGPAQQVMCHVSHRVTKDVCQQREQPHAELLQVESCGRSC